MIRNFTEHGVEDALEHEADREDGAAGRPRGRGVFAPRLPVSPLRVADVVLLALMALAAIAALYLARL
jgi:hypothetical protein